MSRLISTRRWHDRDPEEEMRLIVIGSEYTGKTTLVRSIVNWIPEALGGRPIGFHDHFLPYVGEGAIGRFTSDEEAEEFAKLKPFALEKYLRYMTHYHLAHGFYADADHLVINWYYGDAVYGPLYFGFGGPGEYSDRQQMARMIDNEVVGIAPDTVLIHLTATPEVIRARMAAGDPRPLSPFRAEDAEQVVAGFEREYENSGIRRRFAIDTSNQTPEETFEAFLEGMRGRWSEADQLRMLSNDVLLRRQSAAIAD
jgi:hypothetical protein